MGGGGGGGLGNVVKQATSIVTGGGGGVGGVLGAAGGQYANTGKSILGAMDPLDIYGYKAAGRDRDTENMIASQERQMDKFMSERPKFGSRANASGTLNSKYKLQGPEDAKATLVSTRDLDKRMNQAKEVDADTINVKDVKYTGDVNAGSNFKDAQGNINQLQKRAFGTETSPWAQKLYDQQKLQQQDQLGQLGHEQRTAFNQATNDLAMQGGLEGGSRERLARGSSRDSMMARQGVFRQGQHDRLGIGINDEAQRMQLQTQLPGMNMQMDQYNTGLQQQNRDVKNTLNLANQGKDMTQQQFNSNQLMNEQQFNANLNMNQANLWAQTSDANAGRQTGVSQFNAGQQNQVNAINQATLVGNLQAKNAYNMEGWQTKGSVLGNQQTANMQARQSSGKGGFLQNTLGIGGGLFG
jgi:hypothetical protein